MKSFKIFLGLLMEVTVVSCLKLSKFHDLYARYTVCTIGPIKLKSVNKAEVSQVTLNGRQSMADRC